MAQSNPWNKSPWGTPAQAPAAAPVSLAAVAQEQKDERVAHDMDRHLRDTEADELQRAIAESAREAAFLQEAFEATSTEATATPVPATGDEEDPDLALARKLQEEEDAMARSNSQNGASSTAASTPAVNPEEDLQFAMALQAHFNAEHDEHVHMAQQKANLTNSQKLTVSFERYLSPYPTFVDQVAPDLTDEQEEDNWDDSIDEAVYYHKQTRTMRDMNNKIITKHNPIVNGRKNRQRMESQFPIGFASGDMKAHGKDLKINNAVFNHLRRFAHREERHTARVHEKKDHSTSVMAMDKTTRLLLFKLLNRGVFEQINGAISTGKEAVVFHGAAHIDPEDLTSEVTEVAIKVFKTTLTEFTQRQQFLHGDRRFENRVGRQPARKLVRVWAEKEMANLTRMHRQGMNCPRVVLRKHHVLVMSFIGQDGHSAPKLKDVRWSLKRLNQCFHDTLEQMALMWQQCRLVHCDLSEYNILYHEEKPWIIDVGQAVEPQHPRAFEYLFRDCLNVYEFFERAGATELVSPADMFAQLTGEAISEEAQAEFKHKIQCVSRGAMKTHELQSAMADSSNVVFTPADQLPSGLMVHKQAEMSGDHGEGAKLELEQSDAEEDQEEQDVEEGEDIDSDASEDDADLKQFLERVDSDLAVQQSRSGATCDASAQSAADDVSVQ
ncbi:uncharacterized protein MONBRDRAFT_34008 [Monosiga brevicollis MX1]|uniref:non-specific serine/threonine protein kinase n=1 Tax=Monosiga brevicollis TaxID=81824 RepID=A9V926_MONBE|nr:uncharacterized protein MONBRDRAFT_34008 [Monosiga brevicollis MX1]EDQ86057.1 predicted protein [Monosiga brevicollis MX1]|eukprot:XP_001749251.1 hypothetical protein [Monosiga brevicollis MX1]